ncbi:MAG: DUF853 family protein [Eubacteriales bacterium]|nr:DUF853 family protein [Eubacteriales bacterium]
MYNEEKIWIGQDGEEKVCIIPKMANRHGLIAGATGTGKTITLKVLAESFSDAGVPVFLADAKGDLAGMCQPGNDTEDMQKRIKKFGLEDIWSYHAYPTALWDVYGKMGHPLRTTISEMGPLLLGKLMGLNDTQTDILSIVFRIADDAGLLLIDIKDLRSMLTYVGDHTKDYVTAYGNMTKQSIGAIVRTLVNLEEQGGDVFFGEPAVDVRDWFRTDADGRGYINVLAADTLMNYPDMYGTFMLWAMSELFETLPEAGDADKPKMVFFFDEAHMLFNGASPELLRKIEQVVKLIRSKGVGIYFITQSPSDIPGEVLGQLGNRIQHALRAYTPTEQKALKAAADSFRENPEFKTVEVLQELGIGEALVSVLDEEGRPTVVRRCKILCPQSRMGAITDMERQAAIQADAMAAKYDESIDRDSAYEFLNRKAVEEQQAEEAEKAAEEQAKAEAAAAKEKAKQEAEQAKILARLEAEKEKEKKKEEAAAAKERAKAEAAAAKEAAREARERERAHREMMKTMGKVATNVGNQLVRGLFKNLTKR